MFPGPLLAIGFVTNSVALIDDVIAAVDVKCFACDESCGVMGKKRRGATSILSVLSPTIATNSCTVAPLPVAIASLAFQSGFGLAMGVILRLFQVWLSC